MLWLLIQSSALASVASEHGFDFHHAEGKMCVLKRWLPQGREVLEETGVAHEIPVDSGVLAPA